MAGIPAVLASAGIRFVVVERLPPDEVDGAILWLTRDSPAIALSLRDERIGAVWHTLMCQTAHVALGGSSGHHAWFDPPIGTYSLPKRARDRAKSAEDAASEFLLAASAVPGRGGRYLYRYLDLLVERVNAHPGIVLFQLRRRRVIRPRKTKAEEEVGVRAHLIREALTDGWGHFPKAEPQDLDKTRLRTSCPP
jgi:HTH-type transcriptional regulator/antitoxin HigA